MSEEVGSIHYKLDLQKDKFDKEIDNSGNKVESFGDKLKNLSPTWKMVAAGAVAAASALAAIGARSLSVAKDYEQATAIMIKGTGATGEALELLQENFRFVNKMVPESSEVVAGALADINTRLGLTSSDLEVATQAFLDFARINNQDVSASIQQVTRLMGDWGVSVYENEIVMDLLSKVAQDTGASIDQLAQDSVTYGVQLRTLGFTMEESIAMLGKFEKEGVATSKVFSGLSIAMANLAETGGDIPTEFNKAMEAIKEAKNDADATSIAMDLFGRRAGPDLAIAVREGRFEIDEYIESLGDYQGLTWETAQASLTFAERQELLKKKIDDLLLPLGELLLGALEKVFKIIEQDVIPAIDKLSKFITDNREKIIALGIGITAALLPTIASLVVAFAFWAVGAGIAAAATFLAALPVIALGAAVALVAYLIIKNWDWVSEKTTQLANWILTKFNEIRAFFDKLPGFVRAALSGLAKTIAGPFGAAWDLVKPILDKIRGGLDKINPFHRESPSLVDNVRMGVREISQLYSSLQHMIPDIPTVTDFPTGGNISGQTSNNYNIQIDRVNDIQDAQMIARELGFRTSLNPTI